MNIQAIFETETMPDTTARMELECIGKPGDMCITITLTEESPLGGDRTRVMMPMNEREARQLIEVIHSMIN